MIVRNTTIDFYRRVTGNYSIPCEQYCLALCGDQLNENGYQIRQYIDAGFLRESQYIGLDDNAAIIAANKKRYKRAQFVCGNYRHEIARMVSSHSLALIDLDTTGVGNCEATIELAARTLRLADPGTVVAFNVSLNIPAAPHKFTVPVEDVLNAIYLRLPSATLAAWQHETTQMGTFSAQTSRSAKMQTFLFYRPKGVSVSHAA